MFLSDAETGLTADQQNALKDGNFTQIVIVGGAQAVPEFVSAQIEQTVGIKPIRIAGQTRYNTSILFARWAIGQGALTMNNVVFTTGQNYPDALSGGPLAGRDASCMLLVNNSDATVSMWEAMCLLMRNLCLKRTFWEELMRLAGTLPAGFLRVLVWL